MDRVAIFVDAGYLFAQGSVALTGSQKPRSDISIDPLTVINELKSVANIKAPDTKLLRIYWYDGAVGGSRPTTDQARLAHLDDVKLRLGFINNAGQQKGVDSLIVTDLIEIARQKSICDAILLSGDEDVRVGVQIAQNYGVRVHLLGIVPSRGSQSQQLMQEADTTYEWDAETVKKFLTIRAGISRREKLEQRDEPKESQIIEGDSSNSLIEVVSMLIQSFEKADFDGIAAYWTTERGVPPDNDKKLLFLGRQALGRELERVELKMIRREFQNQIKLKIEAK